jgi:hypothetical protein
VPMFEEHQAKASAQDCGKRRSNGVAMSGNTSVPVRPSVRSRRPA